MKCTKNWSALVDKFKKKLSLWKAKNLSFGGRITLCKSVLGSIPVYYLSLFKLPEKVLLSLEKIRRRFLWGGNSEVKKIAWVKWEKVLAPKKLGGLGIRSLKASNLALLSKWWWRFLTENHALWNKTIKSIHGCNNSNVLSLLQVSSSGVWSSICKIKSEFSWLNLQLDSLFIKKVGDGIDTLFWHENWAGNFALATRFPRLYALELDGYCSIHDRCLQLESAVEWRWKWRREIRPGRESQELSDLTQLCSNTSFSIGKDKWFFVDHPSGSFITSLIRTKLESKLLESGNSYLRWINWIPIKVNALIWKVFHRRVPTRLNVQKRIPSVTNVDCPMCDSFVENEDHLFFTCEAAISIWRGIGNWCRFDFASILNLDDLFMAIDNSISNKTSKKLLLAIAFCSTWFIWKARNEKVFCATAKPIGLILDDIQATSFHWIKNRKPTLNLDWFTWVCSPLETCNK